MVLGNDCSILKGYEDSVRDDQYGIGCDAKKNIMGYTSRFERVILRAGAMLIFSVLFQF